VWLQAAKSVHILISGRKDRQIFLINNTLLGEIEKENIYMRYKGLNGILSINNS
jgi:hypothetical protein